MNKDLIEAFKKMTEITIKVLDSIFKCEVLDCNEPKICFHYCQEHHIIICKPSDKKDE